jgi:hypothetical protein
MGRVILAITVIAILVGVGGYLIQTMQMRNEPISTQDISEISTTSATNSNTPDELMSGGNSYMDPDGVYTLLYPNDYTQDTQGNGQHVRFYKQGATQQGQTEMYDGVIITIETVDLENQTLSNWIDTKIKESTADGTVEITQPKTQTTVNGFPGFTYTTRSLGEATYYVVQKDNKSKNAVVITTLVADPQNVGYQTEVDNTLNTIQLLK